MSKNIKNSCKNFSPQNKVSKHENKSNRYLFVQKYQILSNSIQIEE